MKAYVQGVRVYNDAYRKGIGRDAVNNIIANRAGREAGATGAHRARGPEPGRLPQQPGPRRPASLVPQRGYLQRDLEMDAVVDTRFCDRAVQELGRYAN